MKNSFLIFIDGLYNTQGNMAVHILDNNSFFKYSSILNIESYVVDNIANRAHIFICGENGEELSLYIDKIEYDEMENEYVCKLNSSTTIIISDLEEC